MQQQGGWADAGLPTPVICKHERGILYTQRGSDRRCRSAAALRSVFREGVGSSVALIRRIVSSRAFRCTRAPEHAIVSLSRPDQLQLPPPLPLRTQMIFAMVGLCMAVRHL